MSETLAELNFSFDYSHDEFFVAPSYPFFPAGGKPYDYSNLSAPDVMKKYWNPVVGKNWGRVVTGLSMEKQGAFMLEGDSIFGRAKIEVRMGSTIHSRYVAAPGQFGGNSDFAMVTKFDGEYKQTRRTEVKVNPVMLAGNWGHLRYAFLLMPKPMLAQMERRHGHHLRDWFGGEWREKGEIELGTSAIPFPFYAKDLEYKDYKHFTRAEIRCGFQVDPDWTVSHVAVAETMGGDCVLSAPVVGNEMPLLFGIPPGGAGRNPYNLMARLLDAGVGEKLWSLESNPLMSAVVAGERVDSQRRNLIRSFSGSGIVEEVLLQQESLTPLPIPDGLTELPELPKGCSYIADMSGLVYVVDAGLKTVLYPYQIFDLPKMRLEYEHKRTRVSGVSLDDLRDSEEEFEYSDPFIMEVVFLGRQIKLVEELFLHQESVLQGNVFNYKMVKGMD